MVQIREKIQENENYKKIYVTDIMSDKISDWTHHIIYFDKAPGDRVIFAEAEDTTVDLWMDQVFVGDASDFDDCHRVDIGPCEGICLFILEISRF
jgi:hypothetical protein